MWKIYHRSKKNVYIIILFCLMFYAQQSVFAGMGIVLEMMVYDNDYGTNRISTMVNDNFFTVYGSINDTNLVTTNWVTKIVFATASDNIRVLFPNSTNITESSGAQFNFEEFTISSVVNNVRGNYPDAIAAFDLGVAGQSFNFSEDLVVTVPMDSVSHTDGQEFPVFYQNDGDLVWNEHTMKCVVAGDVCTFTTNHATTYVINGSSGTTLSSISGIEQNDITTDVQDVLSMDCDQTGNTNDNIVEFGNLTPGTPVTASTTCTVTTNSDAGYTLAVRRNDATSTMDKDGDVSTDITDRTNWDAAGAGNATTWQINDTNLAFTVYNTTATKNTTWWGTGTTITDANNLYAGFPIAYQDIMQHAGYDETATTIDIGYKLDVPTTQKSGIYSGDITYQVVTAP